LRTDRESVPNLSSEIQIAAPRVGAHQFHLKLISHIDTLLTAYEKPFGGRA
jgi:hypothetical protein